MSISPRLPLLGGARLRQRALPSPWPATTALLLLVLLAGSAAGCANLFASDDEPRTFAEAFESDSAQRDQPLLVPVTPPPGYALYQPLAPDAWVPQAFSGGGVPTVTLCRYDPDGPNGLGDGGPSGICFGTSQVDEVAWADAQLDDNTAARMGTDRVVVVAKGGTGFTTEEMFADWEGVQLTADWQRLPWIGRDAYRR